MELKREAARMGIMKPEDLALLSRVLDRTLPAGAGPLEREFHAVTLVNLFTAGERSEDALVTAFAGFGTRADQAA
ncbi:MAG: hypothetical protein AB7S80_02545 [Rhizobiaceae bacterium]